MIQLYTMIKLIMNPKHMRIWCDQANTLDMHATIIMLMANQDSSTHNQGAYLHTATMQGTQLECNNLRDLIASHGRPSQFVKNTKIRQEVHNRFPKQGCCCMNFLSFGAKT